MQREYSKRSLLNNTFYQKSVSNNTFCPININNSESESESLVKKYFILKNEIRNIKEKLYVLGIDPEKALKEKTKN